MTIPNTNPISPGAISKYAEISNSASIPNSRRGGCPWANLAFTLRISDAIEFVAKNNPSKLVANTVAITVNFPKRCAK